MSELIDREVAIRKIEPWLYSEGRGESEINMLRAVIDTLKNMTAVPRWVRCEEEMPKEYGEYLGYANGDVMFLKFDPDQMDEWKWTSYDAEGSFPLRMCDITHWMPLPEPPKEVQE